MRRFMLVSLIIPVYESFSFIYCWIFTYRYTSLFIEHFSNNSNKICKSNFLAYRTNDKGWFITFFYFFLFYNFTIFNFLLSPNRPPTMNVWDTLIILSKCIEIANTSLAHFFFFLVILQIKLNNNKTYSRIKLTI